MERGSGTKGCTKFRSRTGFEKRRLKLPFDFSRTFFVKVATRFAGFVKEHVLKTVSSFCAILYLLRLFFKESKPFLNEQRCRSPLPRNFQIARVKIFPLPTPSLPSPPKIERLCDIFRGWFFYEFEGNSCFHQGKIDILLFGLVKFLSLSLRFVRV